MRCFNSISRHQSKSKYKSIKIIQISNGEGLESAFRLQLSPLSTSTSDSLDSTDPSFIYSLLTELLFLYIFFFFFISMLHLGWCFHFSYSVDPILIWVIAPLTFLLYCVLFLCCRWAIVLHRGGLASLQKRNKNKINWIHRSSLKSNRMAEEFALRLRKKAVQNTVQKLEDQL